MQQLRPAPTAAGEALARTTTVACVQCGADFEDGYRRSGRRARFCSVSCRRQRKQAQTRQYRREGRYPRQPHWSRRRNKNHARSCAECGAPFRTYNPKTICCGRDCGLRWSARKGAASSRALRIYPTRADRDRAQSYRRRAVTASAAAERFSAEEILDRDGWRCRLCGAAIDRSLRWPDRMAASIDHVLPIALGGQHIRANVQAAHLGCNSRKGASLASSIPHEETRPPTVQADPRLEADGRADAFLR